LDFDLPMPAISHRGAIGDGELDPFVVHRRRRHVGGVLGQLPADEPDPPERVEAARTGPRPPA
jgi:hypothetical protein